jgi:hypothetical protein
MRIQKQERGYFLGTHKGAQIEIERYRDMPDRKFYIRVRDLNGEGSMIYDGWSPEGIVTMAQAKREAIRGAMLDEMVPVKDCPICKGDGCEECRDIGLVPV